MVGRALIHGTFVALVVVLAIARPDLTERPDPPWLDEVCATHDICERPPSTEQPGQQ